MAGVEAGEQVQCPACGETVLLKGMIPVLGDGGDGVKYLCVACARRLVVNASEDGQASTSEDVEQDADPGELSAAGERDRSELTS
jgi:DNA-directed RNA polymerase subunit RPC12/RpoP